MMYQSVYVRCPFYVTHDKRSIKCEAEFGDYVKHSFLNSAEFNEHLHYFCYNHYLECPLAQSVEKKYNQG